MMKLNLQYFASTMEARDTICAKLAECYVINGTERTLLMQAKDIEVKYEKEKVEVAILGRITKGNKSSSGKISGSCTIYHNTDLFTKMLYDYQTTGQDIYFDMLIRNFDPTSAAGERNVIIKNCNINNATIASFDAAGETLEQSVEFTAESFDMVQQFKKLPGM